MNAATAWTHALPTRFAPASPKDYRAPTPTNRRERRFSWPLPGATIRHHGGSAVLAIIHAAHPLAQRHNGKFWLSIAGLAARAVTQDGKRLSPRQIQRGLIRAERAGLVGPGRWTWQTRNGRMEEVYVRELRCWPEPRGEGRCYGVTRETIKKVTAMTTRGGKRPGSGRKQGFKMPDGCAQKPTRRFQSVADQLAEADQADQALALNQSGSHSNQSGRRTSSLREEEKTIPNPSGIRNAASASEAASSDFVSGTTINVEALAAGMSGVGRDYPLWVLPSHLMLRMPCIDEFHVAMTPAPPRLSDAQEDDDRIDMLAKAYRGVVRAHHKGLPAHKLDKSTTDKRLRAAMLRCSVALLDHDITPAGWALFSMGIWRTHNGKRRPPPQAWVWQEDRVDKHHGWFHHGTVGNSIGRLVIHGDASKEAGVRWRAMQEAVRGTLATTKAECNVLAERFFPDGLYDRLREQACFEAKRTQRELDARAASGEWVW